MNASRPAATAPAAGIWTLDTAGHEGNIEAEDLDGTTQLGWIAVCSCGWRDDALGFTSAYPAMTDYLRLGMRSWREHLEFDGTTEENAVALWTAPVTTRLIYQTPAEETQFPLLVKRPRSLPDAPNPIAQPAPTDEQLVAALADSEAQREDGHS